MFKEGTEVVAYLVMVARCSTLLLHRKQNGATSAQRERITCSNFHFKISFTASRDVADNEIAKVQKTIKVS